MTRVLVVDDDGEFRELAEALLGSEIDVRAASNGFEALDVVRAFRPHLVLVDLDMPWIDGFDVCRLLRRLPEGAQARIVIVTASKVTDDQVRAAGADAHLEKPFSRTELVRLATRAGSRVAA